MSRSTRFGVIGGTIGALWFAGACAIAIVGAEDTIYTIVDGVLNSPLQAAPLAIVGLIDIAFGAGAGVLFTKRLEKKGCAERDSCYAGGTVLVPTPKSNSDWPLR